MKNRGGREIHMIEGSEAWIWRFVSDRALVYIDLSTCVVKMMIDSSLKAWLHHSYSYLWSWNVEWQAPRIYLSHQILCFFM